MHVPVGNGGAVYLVVLTGLIGGCLFLAGMLALARHAAARPPDVRASALVATTAPVRRPVQERSVAELSAAVVGSRRSLSELWDEFGEAEAGVAPAVATIRVWSIGYERFKNSENFARVLASNGVERLLDVRELPISRKRGFAKTALAEKLAEHGIDYAHAKGLGNPKEFRDLYKAGQTGTGRKLYSSFLLRERTDALRDAVAQIETARTALMCLEHDQGVCHRDVIFAAMRDHLGLSLQVSALDNESCSG